MCGIPKHPRVNPGTLLSIDRLLKVISDDKREEFTRFNPDELWNLEHKYDVIIHEYFGEKKFHLRAFMNGLLVLNWRRNDDPLVIQAVNIEARPDLLASFMKSPGLFFLPAPGAIPPDFTPERYVKMLQTCTVFEATGSVDFARATSFCLDFLHQGSEDDPAS